MRCTAAASPAAHPCARRHDGGSHGLDEGRTGNGARRQHVRGDREAGPLRKGDHPVACGDFDVHVHRYLGWQGIEELTDSRDGGLVAGQEIGRWAPSIE